MEIFSIPVEVVDCNVLPYLDWNDLLRLRRVCKWTKGITDGYLKVHPELAPEIEINEEEKNFKNFLKMGIRTNKIYLKNTSGGEFYRNGGRDASKFMKEFGPLIKSLRVDHISIIVFDKEWEFLNALKNLETFEAKHCGGYSREINPDDGQDSALMSRIQHCQKDTGIFLESLPSVFPHDILKGLKTLKIGNIRDDDGSFQTLFGYQEAILFGGAALKTIAVPIRFNPNPGQPLALDALNGSTLPRSIGSLMTHVEFRMEQSPASNYEVIDFVNYHDFEEEQMEGMISGLFLVLCDHSSKTGIRLMNVSSRWFQAFQPNASEFGKPIVSLINIDIDALSLCMPNLEKIEIRKTSDSLVGYSWRYQGRPHWPSLKTLEITVNSKVGRPSDRAAHWRRDMVSLTTKDLFNFFFQGISREALTELKLEFVEKAGDLPVPKTEHIVASCPNLKKLTLVNWRGTNKALTLLWNGLVALEEVSLEYCKDLGNVAFVGEDVDSPVFLKLAKLKKLTLKGLDQMPKITDTLFSLVLRHLPLTHLILTSSTPVESITDAGIRSLCGGRFAESIQKFPFQNWQLSNVSTEEFKKWEAMFRSSRFL